MKQINLFSANLEGKQLRSEKSLTKKAVSEALRDFEKAIDGAFNAVIKSTDRRARNVANAAKGKYQTALAVVAACYPYQTEDGVLCCKRTNEADVRVWCERKLTAPAARGIVRDALKCFTDGVGTPNVTIVTLGAAVE